MPTRRPAKVSAHLARPKKEIGGGAIHEHRSRLDRLSDKERNSMLRAFGKFHTAIPARTRTNIDRELREIRRARRTGGRRTPVDR